MFLIFILNIYVNLPLGGTSVGRQNHIETSSVTLALLNSWLLDLRTVPSRTV